jgi:hypothetical protein
MGLFWTPWNPFVDFRQRGLGVDRPGAKSHNRVDDGCQWRQQRLEQTIKHPDGLKSPSSTTPVRIYFLTKQIALSPESSRSVLETLKYTFTTLILRDQDLFASDEAAAALLEHIPDQDIVEKVKKSWVSNACSSSEAKWVELLKAVRNSKFVDTLEVSAGKIIWASH